MKKKNLKEFTYRPTFRVQAKNVEEAEPRILIRLSQIIQHPNGIDPKDIKQVEGLTP